MSLKLNELTYSDPIQEVLNQQRTLLEKKDIHGLMEIENVIFYPLAYPDYLTLPKPILLFAHEEALTAYHNGNHPRLCNTNKDWAKLNTDTSKTLRHNNRILESFT